MRNNAACFAQQYQGLKAVTATTTRRMVPFEARCTTRPNSLRLGRGIIKDTWQRSLAITPKGLVRSGIRTHASRETAT